MYYLPWRGTRRSSKAFDRLAFAVPSAFTGVAIEEPAVVCLVVRMLVLDGALGGKAQHDLQPTLRLTKNSPAVRQFTIHTWDDLVEERRAGMRTLIDMLAAGKMHPRIHGHLPLAEAKRAHEMLESGAVLGKLLLRP